MYQQNTNLIDKPSGDTLLKFSKKDGNAPGGGALKIFQKLLLRSHCFENCYSCYAGERC